MTDDQKKKYKAKEEDINAKKHTSRLDRKITFDFAGRRVVEDLSHKQEVFDEHEFLQVWPLNFFQFAQFLIFLEGKLMSEYCSLTSSQQLPWPLMAF